jgi:hypothetical protein
MAGMCMSFGYYPNQWDFQVGDISIATLPNLRQVVNEIEKCDLIHDEWLYAPRGVRSNRVFPLPKTHVITHENAESPDHLEFLVWCLSFFVGMRLTTTEAGFLDATPIKPGSLTDFVLDQRDPLDALSLAESFWHNHRHHRRDIKRVIGIIHALFLSQYPPYLQFEEFTYLYIALDACYALAKSICRLSNQSHNHRIEAMCRQFHIKPPSWALPAAPTGTKLPVSAIRNETLHEALFFEEPLGFAIYGGDDAAARSRNVPLEMGALTCRLLVALLGNPDCDYVTSPVNTHQIFGLDLSGQTNL